MPQVSLKRRVGDEPVIETLQEEFAYKITDYAAPVESAGMAFDSPPPHGSSIIPIPHVKWIVDYDQKEARSV
jgi:hypothetical protein